MKRLLILLSAAILAMTLIYGNASAAVIFDNGAPAQNGAGLWWGDPSFNSSRVADDFILESGASVITDIHWWGGYVWNDNTSAPQATNDFTITIYNTSPTANLPGAPVYSTNIGNVRGNYVGWTNVCGTEIYYYSILTDPIILSADTTYWLEILNNTAYDESIWGWQTSSGMTGIAHWDDTTTSWESKYNQDLAFYLTNDSANVPEPATMLLLSIGLIGVAGLRRKV